MMDYNHFVGFLRYRWNNRKIIKKTKVVFLLLFLIEPFEFTEQFWLGVIIKAEILNFKLKIDFNYF